MSDWRDKLQGLQKGLQAEEKAVEDRKTAVLKAFRQQLEKLKPVFESAEQFGDAFGVDVSYEISRFDDRYPWVRFQIMRPRLEWRVECRDGVLYETVKEGQGAPRAGTLAPEGMAPAAVEKRVTAWMERAAKANRRPPR